MSGQGIDTGMLSSVNHAKGGHAGGGINHVLIKFPDFGIFAHKEMTEVMGHISPSDTPNMGGGSRGIEHDFG